MLDRLEITNFRAFASLHLARLACVNLIVGRNGSGKASLLEALHVYATANADVLREMLAQRDEFLSGGPWSKTLLDFASLVHGRSVAAGRVVRLASQGRAPVVEIRLVPLEMAEDSDGRTRWHELNEGETAQGDVVHGAQVFVDGKPEKVAKPYPGHGEVKTPGVLFLRASEVSRNTLGLWWDSISGTSFEDEVAKALSVVAPIRSVRLVQLATSGREREAMAQRYFRVVLQGDSEPIPLKTLGGGSFRLFQIATAVACLARESARQQAKQGNGTRPAGPILLIDEVENGIHHALHGRLWELVFSLARKYDVQVFATTHSWDCVRGFTEAVAKAEANDGLVLRLEKVEGREQTGAVAIGRDDLPIVVRESIEVR